MRTDEERFCLARYMPLFFVERVTDIYRCYGYADADAVTTMNGGADSASR